MRGSYARGIIWLYGSSGHPLQARRLSTWLRSRHVPEVVRRGVCERATCYISKNDRLLEGEGRYVVIYESEDADRRGRALEVVRKSFLDTAKEADLRDVEIVGLGAFESASADLQQWDKRARRVTGITVAFVNCTDSNRETEFNKWYDTVHIPDILASGLYHTGYRYKKVSGLDRWGKYLAIYETELEPPEKALHVINQHWRSYWRTMGHYIDIVNTQALVSYSRL